MRGFIVNVNENWFHGLFTLKQLVVDRVGCDRADPGYS